MQTKVFEAKQTCHEWPPTEVQKMRVLRRIMEACAKEERCDPTNIGRQFVFSRSLDEQAQAFRVAIQHRNGIDPRLERHLLLGSSFLRFWDADTA
jgi:hypothetical protein